MSLKKHELSGEDKEKAKSVIAEAESDVEGQESPRSVGVDGGPGNPYMNRDHDFWNFLK